MTGAIRILLDHVSGIGYCRDCGMHVFELSPVNTDHLRTFKHYDDRYATCTIASEGSANPYIIHGLGGLDVEGVPHVRGNTRIQDIVTHRKRLQTPKAARRPKTPVL